MTRLDDILKYLLISPTSEAGKHILAAATLDLADAEQRGYRHGVEDGILLGKYLQLANEQFTAACQCAGASDRRGAEKHSAWAAHFRDKAFRGARNISRVEIRQRLEALKNV